MVLTGMRRTKSLLAGLCFISVLGVVFSYETLGDGLPPPYEIRAKFSDAGCRIVDVEQVARTDLDRQRVYVAWCSGMDVYLMVVHC